MWALRARLHLTGHRRGLLSVSHMTDLPPKGLDQSQQCLEAVLALRELICLKDPALLSLEVLGFITKYPDVR